MFFEAQFVQQERMPEELKRSTHQRRSGVKKVEEEYFIKLEQKQAEEAKKNRELEEKKKLTSYIMQGF